jgi:hypothetical protein
VTTITSSAPKSRSSSSIVVIGLGSPISPRATMPCSRAHASDTVQAVSCLCELPVDVGHSEVQAGGEHGREHVNVDSLAVAAEDQLAQLKSRQRLVGDDQQVTLAEGGAVGVALVGRIAQNGAAVSAADAYIRDRCDRSGDHVDPGAHQRLG